MKISKRKRTEVPADIPDRLLHLAQLLGRSQLATRLDITPQMLDRLVCFRRAGEITLSRVMRKLPGIEEEVRARPAA